MKDNDKFGKVLFQMIAGQRPRSERELEIAHRLNETAEKILREEEDE